MEFIKNNFDRPFFEIEDKYLNSLPLYFRFLYTLDLNYDSRMREESFISDFYNTDYVVPLKTHYKPISKIINVSNKIIINDRNKG